MNHMRVSQLWQNQHFWVKYAFYTDLILRLRGKKTQAQTKQKYATPDIFVKKIINYLLDDRKHVVDCVQLF